MTLLILGALALVLIGQVVAVGRLQAPVLRREGDPPPMPHPEHPGEQGAL